jgi:hypothetical protein
MQAEIIPPGEEEKRFRRLVRRRRLTIWAAIVLGVAIAVGLLAVGLIVAAVAAVVGIAAWLIFAILRSFDRSANVGTDETARPRVEIITVRGETLDGGEVVEASPDRRLPGDDLSPPRV